jgi:hypothetical protein
LQRLMGSIMALTGRPQVMGVFSASESERLLAAAAAPKNEVPLRGVAAGKLMIYCRVRRKAGENES